MTAAQEATGSRGGGGGGSDSGAGPEVGAVAG